MPQRAMYGGDRPSYADVVEVCAGELSMTGPLSPLLTVVLALNPLMNAGMAATNKDINKIAGEVHKDSSTDTDDRVKKKDEVELEGHVDDVEHLRRVLGGGQEKTGVRLRRL
ncbi:hypothetical protein V5O48_009931 [Marasmius crinis-equi]|uniref:Uncharacterized protein n=1 Tax=Marasmius crinis-equi TaxID=585013 RepID=A0ABR3FA47_9AGAR